MKFVHIADIHLDRPFTKLSSIGNLGDLKRIEQKKKIKEVIDYVKNNHIDCLFIAGDLYEHQYIKEGTVRYLDKLFREIPQTKVFITPGNHDPYLKNSYYNKFNWSNNVKIFSSKIEKIELEDTDIYGFGFDNFYCNDSKIEEIEISNPNKNNILIMHADLDATINEERGYNPISSKIIENKKFDYIALGHIHKTNFEKNKKIIYPGSLVSLGFDEIGKHGMVVGEIKDKKLDINFIDNNSSSFVEKNIDITNIYSIEELIQEIDGLEIRNNEYVKVNLIGKRNFEVDLYSIYPLIQNIKVIKIKDLTKIKYDFDELERENTLKGLFIKKMRGKLNDKNITEEEKNIIEHAIEIGLNALN